ncbi:DeoR family transcriptional regulator [Geopsychrobacter electrodiphilus]|uniref:DeoR family transcriptional regulator n=1 Tax=Geopsychrobacter electrodiphilus TaxID=225196 RepID=UPI0003772CBA|nr:DeoR family transcriptional regulator [Geopsychrobacter electrodiphilus]
MTPEVRQSQILTLVSRESGISAGQLARHFQVSRMTIHRDLDRLVEQNLLLRIHGGAVAKPLVRGPSELSCSGCERPILPHQRCELHQADGTVSVACCAACGLRQFMQQDGGVSVLVGDQISGRMFPAIGAFFLVNSLAAPCCQPSLLSFYDEQEAALFQSGFGGSVAHMAEALEFLRVAEGLNGY